MRFFVRLNLPTNILILSFFIVDNVGHTETQPRSEPAAVERRTSAQKFARTQESADSAVGRSEKYATTMGQKSVLTTNDKWSVGDMVSAGNTKGGSITVLLTSCLTGLD